MRVLLTVEIMGSCLSKSQASQKKLGEQATANTIMVKEDDIDNVNISRLYFESRVQGAGARNDTVGYVWIALLKKYLFVCYDEKHCKTKNSVQIHWRPRNPTEGWVTLVWAKFRELSE